MLQRLISALLIGIAAICLHFGDTTGGTFLVIVSVGSLYYTRKRLNHYIEQPLQSIAQRLAQACLFIATACLIVGGVLPFSVRDTALFGASLAAALLPIGLILGLRIYTGSTAQRQSLFSALHIARSQLALTATSSLLVVLSTIGTTTYHVLPATHLLPLLVTTLFLLPLMQPLRTDKPQTTQTLSQLKQEYAALLSRHSLLHYISFGALSALLVYANYVFFFVRHQTGISYLDPSLPLYRQATTLSLATLIACFYCYVLFTRADKHQHFFTPHLTSNIKLLDASLLVAIFLTIISYATPAQQLLKTGPLSVLDWLSVVLVASMYTLVRLAQRHTRQHSRRSVLMLHQETKT